MTIDEAIKILTHMSKSTTVASLEECVDAIKLGNEALKAILKMRHYPFPDEILKLPGETEGAKNETT